MHTHVAHQLGLMYLDTVSPAPGMAARGLQYSTARSPVRGDCLSCLKHVYPNKRTLTCPCRKMRCGTVNHAKHHHRLASDQTATCTCVASRKAAEREYLNVGSGHSPPPQEDPPLEAGGLLLCLEARGNDERAVPRGHPYRIMNDNASINYMSVCFKGTEIEPVSFRHKYFILPTVWR